MLFGLSHHRNGGGEPAPKRGRPMPPAHLWDASDIWADLTAAYARDELSEGGLLAICLAYEIAWRVHYSQRRKSGDPYIYHPLAVYCAMFEDGVRDVATLAAALLHDTWEDGLPLVLPDYPVSPEYAIWRFAQRLGVYGSDVVACLRVVTKWPEQPDKPLYLLYVGLSENERAVVIKLYDRCHNMATICYKKSDSQKQEAQQTLLYFPWMVKRLLRSRRLGKVLACDADQFKAAVRRRAGLMFIRSWAILAFGPIEPSNT